MNGGGCGLNESGGGGDGWCVSGDAIRQLVGAPSWLCVELGLGLRWRPAEGGLGTRTASEGIGPSRGPE